jgi:hypothetical protein
MRIVSTSAAVPSGYLYAYLSTREIGYPLLLRTATGDAIPEVWPVFVKRVPVLKAPKQLIREIDEIVHKAFEARVKATKLELEARTKLELAVELSAL